MKWDRSVDYHGSRSYESDEPKITQFSILNAWLASKVRQMIAYVARPTPSAVLLRDGQRNFSVLGGSRKRLERPAECPFPTTLQRPPNPIVPSRLRNEN